MPNSAIMTSGSNTPRRRFLQLAAAAAPIAAVSCGGARSPYLVLTAAEALTLNALCERIIPADQDPGAAGTGTARYVDRQLNGPYRRFRKEYREGLIAVERLSTARFSRAFADLPAVQADQVLADLERGQLAAGIWTPAQAKAFFRMLLAHTMQGFYGDPRHGGNADAASWRMLGVPPAPIRGRRKFDARKP